jgi:putative ABC transport system permease protein
MGVMSNSGLYTGYPLVFVSRPRSVVVSRAFALRLGLGLGDRLRLTVPGGVRTLRVRGFLDDVRAARLFGGSLAVMDLPAAMRFLGRESSIDRILVRLKDGADLGTVSERLAEMLGPAAEVGTPEGRGEQAEKLIASLRAMLATASFLGLILGGFIVYHTVSVAVSQRRRQFALANAVGISRRILRRVCIVETLSIAAVGVLAGLALGHVLGGLMAPLAGSAASAVWLPMDAVQHALSPPEVAVASLMGILAALAAAAVAVRLTFRAPTVEALRPLGEGSGDEKIRPWVVALGVPGLAAGVVLGLLPAGVPVSFLIIAVDFVDAAGMLAAACLAPGFVFAAGWLVHRLTSRTRVLPLRLAAIHLPRAPASGGATAATIAAAIAVASALAILVQSFQSAWLHWIEQHFAADLFVGGGSSVRLLAGPPIGPNVMATIRSVEGVASVEPFRVFHIRLGDRTVFLQGISVADRLTRGGLPMVEGTLEAAAEDLEAGTAVLLSGPSAARKGDPRLRPVFRPVGCPDRPTTQRVLTAPVGRYTPRASRGRGPASDFGAFRQLPRLSRLQPPLGWRELHQVAVLADADRSVVDFDRRARTALGTERDGFRHQLSPPFIVATVRGSALESRIKPHQCPSHVAACLPQLRRPRNRLAHRLRTHFELPPDLARVASFVDTPNSKFGW